MRSEGVGVGGSAAAAAEAGEQQTNTRTTEGGMEHRGGKQCTHVIGLPSGATVTATASELVLLALRCCSSDGE